MMMAVASLLCIDHWLLTDHAGIAPAVQYALTFEMKQSAKLCASGGLPTTGVFRAAYDPTTI